MNRTEQETIPDDPAIVPTSLATGIFPRVSLSVTDLPLFLQQAAWEQFPITAWRRSIRATERRDAQKVLLDTARRAEQTATLEEAIQLYRIAEAILPLEGTGLMRLVRLSLQELPRPLPLELISPLLRYLRRGQHVGQGDNISATAIQAVRGALDRAEAQLPPDSSKAARLQIASWRRALTAITG